MALNDIAALYRLDSVSDPSPGDPISVSRQDFDEMCARLDAEGLIRVDDLDVAWRAWAGWRVNYDVALGELVRLTSINL